MALQCGTTEYHNLAKLLSSVFSAQPRPKHAECLSFPAQPLGDLLINLPSEMLQSLETALSWGPEAPQFFFFVEIKNFSPSWMEYPGCPPQGAAILVSYTAILLTIFFLKSCSVIFEWCVDFHLTYQQPSHSVHPARGGFHLIHSWNNFIEIISSLVQK